MSKTLAVYDPVKIKEGIAEMRVQLGKASEEAASSARSEGAAIAGKIAKLQSARGELYSKIEAAYTGLRAKLKSSSAPVDEPMKAASTERLKTCLNGDQWLMAKADGAVLPLDASSWQSCVLPMICIGEYFRTWSFPVKQGPDGKFLPTHGWEGYQFNPLICAKALWFKKDISIEPGSENCSYSFSCENMSGRLKVYLNGVLCGEYHGSIGIVEIPLQGVKPGANQLALRIDLDERTLFAPHMGWGLRGDLYLERSSQVEVADVEVKTSWRKARLSVSSALENHSAKTAKVRFEQYCALDGRIKYRLKPEELEIAPGGTSTVSNAGTWLEAEPWGIGGDYGKPTLYQMVSDLYVDGQLVDRRTDSFGFREFWIAGTDFFLNGKRIILQGDVGGLPIEIRKFNDVVFPLLRADGVNVIRNHDSAYYSPEFLSSCDKMGMLAYVQMYPVLHDGPVTSDMKKAGSPKLISYEDWLKHPLHQYNLENYARWVKFLRNHPSVVIASTDNEIFTQAWDTLAEEEFNVRNDRLGAFYEKYVKSLNPDLVMTRNGDEGTWGSMGKWHEDPPCDTANYHYPNYNIDGCVKNWQTLYGFRPVIFGETLYCDYFENNRWVGATPDRVAKKATTIREVAGIYRKLEIPCVVYMGLDGDGFVQLDDTGKGNPWGITISMRDAFKEKGVPPSVILRYPWAKIEWPSSSGPGAKKEATKLIIDAYGSAMLNWFDANAPSHVRNAVNDAYRDTLIQQPPLALPSDAECLVDFGEAMKGKVVKAVSVDGLAEPIAMTSDSKGVAWFRLPVPGPYLFECGGRQLKAEVPGRASYAGKPGFNSIPTFKTN